jgi:hypothetical protein
LNLPVRMKARVRPSGTYFYYFDGQREIALGKDYVEAIRKWAELEGGNAGKKAAICITFRYVAEKYQAKVLPTKAPRTQKDNLAELAKLYEFFDNPPAPLDSIEPHLIAQYRDWRKVTRSTQELALFSHIWNWSREQGYTAKPNPTVGVKRNRAKGRPLSFCSPKRGLFPKTGVVPQNGGCSPKRGLFPKTGVVPQNGGCSPKLHRAKA